MSSSHDKRAELLEIILKYSFRSGRVVLSSGKESDFYLDLRQTLMRPRGVQLAGQLLAESIEKGPAVDAVGGMAVGAVPLVAAILSAQAEDSNLVGFFVRKEAKSHGLGRQIEGGFSEGQQVVLVEDTMTTGGSTLAAWDVVEAEGGKVSRVCCLVDRSEGASEAVAERGLKLEALFTRADLPL